MKTTAIHALNPTLWRTCRVLANRCRLRLLADVLRRPNACVTEIAGRLRLPLPVTSRYLRDLNARGLLKARRIGATVWYTPDANRSVPQAAALLAALGRTLDGRPQAAGEVFRLATAFTHPRRVEMAQALAGGPVPVAALGRRTGISRSALKRHLGKLRARGLIEWTPAGYVLARPSSPLAAALLAMARNPT